MAVEPKIVTLPVEVVIENEAIADSNADSTHDGGTGHLNGNRLLLVQTKNLLKDHTTND